MAKITETNVVRSSLWAAFGDALGFPTELVSASDFKRRNTVAKVSTPIAWRRRVGGMFGPDVDFPEGTYSDDTQLRLSASRAINGAGYFDVESFAKVELPVWLNYALGAGRGSKMAAANLALRESSWSLNFFSSPTGKYWDGGGNGAAMRIQPHVWLNHSGTRHAFMSDVLRNSVCTHGHPRALVGAIIHAAVLHETMHSGGPLAPADWASLGEAVGQIGMEMLEADPELPLVWIPSWERLAKRNLREEWFKTVDEWIDASRIAARICESESTDLAHTYSTVLKELKAFDASERGSGLKTPLYASVLAWLYRDQAPEVALAVAANVFGSDTDTIATMAGALMGVLADAEPPTPVQDETYIRNEAARLYRIGRTAQSGGFEYPDLMNWSAPRTQSDAWVSTPNGDELQGLGSIHPYGPAYKSKKGVELVWQWAKLEFGQTVLVKRKASHTSTSGAGGNIGSIEGGSNRVSSADDAKSKQRVVAPRQPPQLSFQEAQMPLLESSGSRFEPTDSLDALTQHCIRGGFDAADLGHALLSLMKGPDAIERAIAFAAIIAKAKVVRSQK